MKYCRSFVARRAAALRTLVLFLSISIFLGPPARAEPPLSASPVVVYNNAAPDSVELAKFYAQRRGIARHHLVGLTCSPDEEISREEYDTDIAEPLREIFKARHWWTMRETPEHQEAVLTTSIRFVAVIKGVPLKIRPTTAPYPGDE